MSRLLTFPLELYSQASYSVETSYSTLLAISFYKSPSNFPPHPQPLPSRIIDITFSIQYCNFNSFDSAPNIIQTASIISFLFPSLIFRFAPRFHAPFEIRALILPIKSLITLRLILSFLPLFYPPSSQSSLENVWTNACGLGRDLNWWKSRPKGCRTSPSREHSMEKVVLWKGLGPGRNVWLLHHQRWWWADGNVVGISIHGELGFAIHLRHARGEEELWRTEDKVHRASGWIFSSKTEDSFEVSRKVVISQSGCQGLALLCSGLLSSFSSSLSRPVITVRKMEIRPSRPANWA